MLFPDVIPDIRKRCIIRVQFFFRMKPHPYKVQAVFSTHFFFKQIENIGWSHTRSYQQIIKKIKAHHFNLFLLYNLFYIIQRIMIYLVLFHPVHTSNYCKMHFNYFYMPRIRLAQIRSILQFPSQAIRPFCR